MSLRIDRFELRAFGPFTGTGLDLRGAPGSLHLLYGPNEAGKSTAQRAIGDFLFGIPARSRDNQLHAHGDMRLSAVLVDGEGRRTELVRRKGLRSTLTTTDGEAIDEGVIESMLGAMSREEFEAMFSITHDSLVLGGETLLAAGGEVGESLFSASLGAGNLHRVREALDAEAAELFRPQARKSRVMQARAALEAAEAQLRERTVRASAYTDLERTLAATTQQRSTVTDQLRTARADQRTRRRVRAVVPLLVKRDAVSAGLLALADVPEIPADAAARRVRAQERADNGRAGAREAERRIHDLEAQTVPLEGGETLLEHDTAITELHGRLSAIREARDDSERQRAKLELATSLARHVTAEVRADIALEDAPQLLVDARQRQRIETALETRGALVAKLESAEQEAAAAAQSAARLGERIERMGPSADTAGLELALAAAQDEGPLEAQLAAAEDELHAAEQSLALAAAELSPRVDPERLAEMTCPSSATLERFAAWEDALTEQATKLTEARLRLERDRRRLAQDRSRLSLDSDVPTLEELVFARSRRDRDWARIRSRLEGDALVEISPENLERGLRVADEVADSLREHAALAAQLGDLDVRDERLGQEFTALSRADQDLAGQRDALAGEWAELWASSGLTPLSPREMGQWLRDRTTVLERSGAVARWSRAAAALCTRRDRHRAALSAELGAAAGQDAAELTRLVIRARTRTESAAAERAEALELRHDLESAEAARARHDASTGRLRSELERWQLDWSELILSVGWPSDVAPDEARQMLGTLDELSRHLRDRDAVCARVEGIARRIDDFEATARGLVAAVAPELADWACLDAVSELRGRLEAARERRNHQRDVTAKLASAREDLLRFQAMLDNAAATLAELVSRAGVDTPEALEAVEAAAARRTELRVQLPELEQQIAEVGQAPLAELVTQSAGVDLDALDAEIQAAETDIVALETEQSRLDGRLGELRSEREAMERGGGAAGAGQVVEQHLAELRALVEHYLRVYVAAWALHEAIDQYRRDHKDPLLRRASELFPRLTAGGSFTGLEADFDEADEPVLIGVRAGGERVRVEAMSTGTREQLYLALRLASLERHVELHGPVPVILDDVVLHSDPRRSTAILEALAELGRATQVICFSHDPQLVALAEAALDPSLLTVHELGSREIEHALHPEIGGGDVRPLRAREAA